MPRGLIPGALVSVGVRLLDLPSRYGFHLLIAAKLGVAGAGNFYIVFSIMTILAGFGRLSVDRMLTRELAAALAQGRAGDVPALLRRGFVLIFVLSSAVAGLLAAAAIPMADFILDKPALAGPMMLGALSLIPQNLGAAAAGGLAGLQRIGLSQMVYSWLWPASFCLLALVVPIDLPTALLMIAGCFTLAAMVGIVLLLRALPGGGDGASYEQPALLRPGLSLFTLELTQLAIAGAPPVILGIVADSARVGLFSLAWRVALLANVLVSGIAGMATPKFAEHFAAGDRVGLSRAAGQAVLLGLVLSVPPILVMLAAPTMLLGLVGRGFDAGASTLRILALGQLSAACFTAMPELLGMTNHLAALRRVNALSLLVLVAGCAILAPHWANDGAAVATVLAIMVNGAGAALAAHRDLAIAPLRDLWISARRAVR